MMRCDIDSWNSTAYQFCHGDSPPPWLVSLDDPNGRKAQAAIFVASAFMLVLGGLLFGLGLFGRLSGRATLNFSVRIFLYRSFSLFVPLMSYMFSQAKEQQAEMHGNQGLPFHAHVVLIWMLVVELLRKKVDTIIAAMRSSPLRGVHRENLWDAIDQIVRIAWIGYLIYFHGFRKPGFMILWVLTLIKTAQRVAAVEFSKRSFAIGRNAHLVMGYTAQMVEGEEISNEQNEEISLLLSKCWYAVMGEEKLKREAGPDGYRVELPHESSDRKDLITVGDIWKLAEGGGAKAADILLADHPELKDLCLSFALFKLLRARLEKLQVDEVHKDIIRKNRELIFRGLVESGGDGNNSDSSKDIAERAFHVIELEINFVSDYYNSVVPVMMSSPWFFVGNYIFVLLIMVNQAIMVLFITGNARVLSTVGCLARDVLKLSRRAIGLFKCLRHKLLKTIIIMFSSFNVIISLLIVLTFLVMEVWELFVYVFSDWFLVSLLCEYARRPKWQLSRCARRAFCALLWVKRVGRRRSRIRFNQVCVLDPQRHTPWLVISKVLLQHRLLGMPSVPVPREVKHAIFASIKSKNGELLSNGAAVLHRHDYPQLLQACEGKSITEVILVWQIATCLFEMKNSAALSRTEETVATTLSKYCAYLVACARQLLPEDREWSERVYKAVKRELRSARSKGWRRSKSESTRVTRTGSHGTVANRGYEVCRQLVEECGLDAAQGWALLAELWTELIVYVAPSDNTEGHAEALARGGEFVTVLWALATHAGITRPSRTSFERSSTF